MICRLECLELEKNDRDARASTLEVAAAPSEQHPVLLGPEHPTRMSWSHLQAPAAVLRLESWLRCAGSTCSAPSPWPSTLALRLLLRSDATRDAPR
eukprot:3699476-Rhodomonas_salina.1